MVRVVAVTPESLSALGLYRYIGYLQDNGLDSRQFEVALWSKFAYPLATGVMIVFGFEFLNQYESFSYLYRPAYSRG